jgi:hypothetical protein
MYLIFDYDKLMIAVSLLRIIGTIWKILEPFDL